MLFLSKRIEVIFGLSTVFKSPSRVRKCTTDSSETWVSPASAEHQRAFLGPDSVEDGEGDGEGDGAGGPGPGRAVSCQLMGRADWGIQATFLTSLSLGLAVHISILPPAPLSLTLRKQIKNSREGRY